MKIKDIDDLIKIVEVISQINIPNYIISINSDEIIKTLEEVKLILPDVVNSFNFEIKDRDIATIEALHDTLLDEKVLGLNSRSMKESRALTQRMYKALSEY